MEFYDVLKARKSIRGYKAEPVPQDAVARIAEAVNLAPTACNRQPFKLLLVKNEALRRKICGIYTQPWLAQAPAIAVMLGDSSQAWKRLEGDSIIDVDAAIAMEHFVLAAAAEGLGSCWICAYPRDILDAALGIRAPWRSVAISPLGYSNDSGRERTRKNQSEIFEVID